MPDPMMVRLAVSSPDSPPLNSGSTQVIATNAGNSYDAVVQPTTTTPPVQASVSPSQQNSHQMAQNIPPGAIPLNQMSPHHMPPFHHHPHSGGANGGGHIHDHNNGHHHNGLYLGPAYANEFYPAGADAPPHGAYFIPPEMCPAHPQLCTVHPEYGKKHFHTLIKSLTSRESWVNLERRLTLQSFLCLLSAARSDGTIRDAETAPWRSLGSFAKIKKNCAINQNDMKSIFYFSVNGFKTHSMLISLRRAFCKAGRSATARRLLTICSRNERQFICLSRRLSAFSRLLIWLSTWVEWRRAERRLHES